MLKVIQMLLQIICTGMINSLKKDEKLMEKRMESAQLLFHLLSGRQTGSAGVYFMLRRK
jgi:hypothetical protein